MSRTWWRQLASGLLAATLSLGIAACDDDTSSGTGDMAVGGADMSANVDMTMGSPGIGQIVLADVVGTVYTTQPAPKDNLYRTHALIALASMPKVVPTSDPSSDLSLTPPGGCTINRFTSTNLPASDGDAGQITIAGWNTNVVGVSAATGTSSLGSTMSPITCDRGGPLMKYTCSFGGTSNPDGGGMGMTSGSVIFPLIPHQLIDDGTKGTVVNVTIPPASGGWPYTDADCIPRACGQEACPAPAGALTCDVICCEQSPVAVGQSNITETVAGGTDYAAGTKMLGNDSNADAGAAFFPQPLYLISVTQGSSTTSIAGTDLLTGGPSLSMDQPIDTTQSMTLTFSCDGSATPGGGCAGASDLAALLITSSTSPRTTFAVSTATGSAECISPLTNGTITIMGNQLTALIGSQTGGSVEIALARLRLVTGLSSGHIVAYTGGMGVFGFTNQ